MTRRRPRPPAGVRAVTARDVPTRAHVLADLRSVEAVVAVLVAYAPRAAQEEILQLLDHQEDTRP